MKDIKALSDSFPGCARVYMMEDTFERLPKLVDALYPLVEERKIKITYYDKLTFDKTLMVDDSDLEHFASVCKYRIEDAGGGEYILANNLEDYMFPMYDAYPKEFAHLEDGEEFYAIGYAHNKMKLAREITIAEISHPELNNTLVKALDHLDLSSTCFTVRGLKNKGLLNIKSISPSVRNIVEKYSVEELTKMFEVIFVRSF